MESSDDHVEQPHCRFCNEESTSERPLFFPCKCKGSMKFIHQECLQDWIKHSGNSSCTVCGEVIRFEKVYFENATCVEFKIKVAFKAWKWGLIYCFEGMLLGLRYLYWFVGLPLFMGWSCEICWSMLRNGTISWTGASEFARFLSMWKAGWIELAIFGIFLVFFLAVLLGFLQIYGIARGAPEQAPIEAEADARPPLPPRPFWVTIFVSLVIVILVEVVFLLIPGGVGHRTMNNTALDVSVALWAEEAASIAAQSSHAKNWYNTIAWLFGHLEHSHPNSDDHVQGVVNAAELALTLRTLARLLWGYAETMAGFVVVFVLLITKALIKVRLREVLILIAEHVLNLVKIVLFLLPTAVAPTLIAKRAFSMIQLYVPTHVEVHTILHPLFVPYLPYLCTYVVTCVVLGAATCGFCVLRMRYGGGDPFDPFNRFAFVAELWPPTSQPLLKLLGGVLVRLTVLLLAYAAIEVMPLKWGHLLCPLPAASSHPSLVSYLLYCVLHLLEVRAMGKAIRWCMQQTEPPTTRMAATLRMLWAPVLVVKLMLVAATAISCIVRGPSAMGAAVTALITPGGANGVATYTMGGLWYFAVAGVVRFALMIMTIPLHVLLQQSVELLTVPAAAALLVLIPLALLTALETLLFSNCDIKVLRATQRFSFQPSLVVVAQVILLLLVRSAQVPDHFLLRPPEPAGEVQQPQRQHPFHYVKIFLSPIVPIPVDVLVLSFFLSRSAGAFVSAQYAAPYLLRTMLTRYSYHVGVGLVMADWAGRWASRTLERVMLEASKALGLVTVRLQNRV